MRRPKGRKISRKFLIRLDETRIIREEEEEWEKEEYKAPNIRLPPPLSSSLEIHPRLQVMRKRNASFPPSLSFSLTILPLASFNYPEIEARWRAIIIVIPGWSLSRFFLFFHFNFRAIPNGARWCTGSALTRALARCASSHAAIPILFLFSMFFFVLFSSSLPNRETNARS